MEKTKATLEEACKTIVEQGFRNIDRVCREFAISGPSCMSCPFTYKTPGDRSPSCKLIRNNVSGLEFAYEVYKISKWKEMK